MVVQDLELEYVIIFNDGIIVYVFCQENNVLLVVDIINEAVIGILLFGYKDWMVEGVMFDVFNCIDNIFFVNWNIKGMYQFDVIDFFIVGG